jgi:hypothetical protein
VQRSEHRPGASAGGFGDGGGEAGGGIEVGGDGAGGGGGFPATTRASETIDASLRIRSLVLYMREWLQRCLLMALDFEVLTDITGQTVAKKRIYVSRKKHGDCCK